MTAFFLGSAFVCDFKEFNSDHFGDSGLFFLGFQ